MTHSTCKTVLHEQLLQLSGVIDAGPMTTASELCSRSPRVTRSPGSVPSSLTNHQAVVSSDARSNGRAKYRVCKVCSALHEGGTQTIHTTRSFCQDCSTEKGRVYLCDRIRRQEVGNQLTCFQIWHNVWKNGTSLPVECDKRLRLR